MKTTCLFLLAGALALGACTDDPKGEGPGPGPDGKLSVVEWANDMAHRAEPDTIQDKFAIVIDTEDPTAFKDVIEASKQQTAAETAAGD